MLVGGDLRGGDAQLQAIAEAVAQEDEALGIAKRQRPQKHAFDEREDGGGGSDAQRKGENDGEGKAGRFPELAEGEAKVAHRSEDTSHMPHQTSSKPTRLTEILGLPNVIDFRVH